ncbi:MAG: VOC family protein [Acidimicrobiia bacterium]
MELDHVGVNVISLDEALVVLTGALGFELMSRETINDVAVAFVRLGSLELEVVEKRDARPGLSHLGLRVDDVRRAVADIDERVRPAGTIVSGTRGSVVQLLDAATTAGIPMHFCSRELNAIGSSDASSPARTGEAP